jgi:hypothetical protein
MFVSEARAGTGFNFSMIFNAGLMHKIVFCFGFLFIFLEFLHAQTSGTFIRDKSILAGIMGITTCIAIFIISYKSHFNAINTLIYLPYIMYALRIFVFSLLGKEDKTSMLFKCSFIAFVFLWVSLATPHSIGGGDPSIINSFTLKIYAVFGCTLLIPLKCKQSAEAILVLFQNPFENGIYMLVIRFLYFVFLADGIATIWMREWY